MAHARTQIRNAVAAQLGGLPLTGAHVFVNRLHKLVKADLPALIVRTDDESIDAIGIGFPSPLERRLVLGIECVAIANAALDTTLDDLIEQVEAAMSASPSAVELGGLAKSVRLQSVAIDIEADADVPVGRAELRYEITYFTPENQPDVAS